MYYIIGCYAGGRAELPAGLLAIPKAARTVLISPYLGCYLDAKKEAKNGHM